jgi:hypothetical protein
MVTRSLTSMARGGERLIGRFPFSTSPESAGSATLFLQLHRTVSTLFLGDLCAVGIGNQ